MQPEELHAVDAPGKSPLPLAGRAAELESLGHRLAKIGDNHGEVLAYLGQRGMGKSRLAQAALERARADHPDMRTAVLSLRGGEQFGGRLLAALVNHLLGIDPGLPRARRRALVEEALETLEMRPARRAMLGLLRLEEEGEDLSQPTTMPKPPLLPSDDSQFYYADLPGALARLCRRLSSGDKRLLLIFDDADRADTLTRLLLLRLVGLMNTHNIMVVLTATEALPRELEKAFRQDSLPLGALSREEADALAAEALNDQPLPAERAEALWQAAQGRPFDVLLMAPLAAQDGPLPGASKALIERLQSLPEPLLKALQAGAIFGEAFTVPAIRRMESGASLQQFEALREAGWLAHSADGEPVIYSFRHAAVPDALRALLSPEKRSALHLKAGEHFYASALLSENARPEARQALEHFMQAGSPQEALASLDLAISEAQKTPNRQSLIDLNRQALEIAARDQLGGAAARYAERLGDIYALGEDYRQAAVAYSEVSLAAAPPMLVGKLGLALLAVGPARAAHVLARAIEMTPQTHPDDLRWRLAAGMVWAQSLKGQHYEAMRTSRDALATLAQLSGYGSASTLLRGTLGLTMLYNNERSDALPHLQSARSGWQARSEHAAVDLVDKALAGAPVHEVTLAWLRFVLRPLLSQG